MRNASATESTFRPALLLMSGRALAFVATFLTPVVLVRVLDQAEFGTYKQFFLIYSTLFYIAQFGMAESLFYFLPTAGAAGGRYVVNSVLFLAGAGMACVGLLAAGGPWIAEWLNNPALRDDVPLIGVFLLLMMLSAGLEIVMIARKRYLWATVSYGASDVVRAAALILPGLLLRRVEAVLLGAVLFALLRCGAAFRVFTRSFAGALRFDAGLLREQLAYAGPFGVAILFEIVQANWHQYVVSHHFDAATFAVYTVGCLQIPFVDFLATAASNVMMVRIAEVRQGGHQAVVLALWHDATRKLALIFFPMVGLLLVVAPELIELLFTESYRASVPVFMISTMGIGLAPFMTDAVLRVYGQTRFLIVLNAVRLTLIVSLVSPLIGALHLRGAILATVVAAFVAKSLALARTRQLIGVGLAQLLPWRNLVAIAAVSAGAALAGALAKSCVGTGTLPALVAATLVTAGVYGALLLRPGLLSAHERQTVAVYGRRLFAGALGTAAGSD